MPNKIVKPEALIKEEEKIFSAWSAKYNQYDNEWSAKYNQYDNEWSAKYTQYDNEWSAKYSDLEEQHRIKKIDDKTYEAQQMKIREDREEKRSLIRKDREEKQSLIRKDREEKQSLIREDREEKKADLWNKYGWSQELEDAYQKQENDALKAAHPDPVKPQPKNVAKPTVKTLDTTKEPQESKDVRAAIKEFTDTWYFDSEEKKALLQKDAAADKINVAVSEEGQRVVAVTSNVFITGYNGVKPHPMTAEEKSETVKAVERFVQNSSFAQLSDGHALEVFVKGANATYRTDDNSVNVTAILTDDKKHALLATDKGAYEVIDVKPEAPLPVPAGNKPIVEGKPKGK